MEKKSIILLGGMILLLAGSAMAAGVNWNTIVNFPSPCASGQAVTGINTTPSCAGFVTSTGDNTVTGALVVHSVNNAVNSLQVEDSSGNVSFYVDQRNVPRIVYSTEHDPVVTNTSNLGSSTHKWNEVFANIYHGSVFESQAVSGTSCTSACTKWNSSGLTASCIAALNSSGTSVACSDTTVRKDCLCQN